MSIVKGTALALGVSLILLFVSARAADRLVVGEMLTNTS